MRTCVGTAQRIKLSILLAERKEVLSALCTPPRALDAPRRKLSSRCVVSFSLLARAFGRGRIPATAMMESAGSTPRDVLIGVSPDEQSSTHGGLAGGTAAGNGMAAPGLVAPMQVDHGANTLLPSPTVRGLLVVLFFRCCVCAWDCGGYSGKKCRCGCGQECDSCCTGRVPRVEVGPSDTTWCWVGWGSCCLWAWSQ